MGWLSHTTATDRKITCVTVTKNRFELLKVAIQCYVSQTYIDKELLIASQNDDNHEIENYLAQLGRKDIRLFPIDVTLSLGEARKTAAWEAYGDIVCQWDDDDLYHPKRLSTQFHELMRTNSVACFYDSHLKYFKEDKEVYWVDWSLEQGEPWHRILAGSAMYVKKQDDQYLDVVNFYPNKHCYEDADFAEQVFKKYPVAISKFGYQYVYVYHGQNVYDARHHYGVLRSKHVYDKADVLKNNLGISESLRYADKPLRIMGADGLAYEI